VTVEFSDFAKIRSLRQGHESSGDGRALVSRQCVAGHNRHKEPMRSPK
jgi:hypothetical protein